MLDIASDIAERLPPTVEEEVEDVPGSTKQLKLQLVKLLKQSSDIKDAESINREKERIDQYHKLCVIYGVL